MIADMEANKKLIPIVTELLMREKEKRNVTHFIFILNIKSFT